MSSAKDCIRPYEKNRWYWAYKNEPTLFIGGTKEDNLFQIPDLKEHLELLKSVGGNAIRNTMSDRDSGNVYAYAKEASGKYDLDKWNPEYWIRFENMLKWTNEMDILVQIEIWDRFDHSRTEWLDDPYNPKNNINYTYEETGFEEEYPKHPGKDFQPFFHTIPGLGRYSEKLGRIRIIQERYVEKILSYSLNYGNVLYCMNNETSSSYKWGQYWMDFINSKAKEKNREIYVTDMFDDAYRGKESEFLHIAVDNPDLYPFIDVSQNNSRNFKEVHWENLQWFRSFVKEKGIRPMNNTKIYGSGNTSWGSGTPQDGVERFFRNILGGCATARFHRPHCGNGLSPVAQASIKAMRKLETMMKMWELEPHMELLSDNAPNEAYVSAKPGERYAIYFPDGGDVKLDLTGWSVDYKVKWIHIDIGEWADEAILKGGEKVAVAAPGKGNWLVGIVKE